MNYKRWFQFDLAALLPPASAAHDSASFVTLQGLATSHRKQEVPEDVKPKACPGCGSIDTRLSHRDHGVLAFLLPFFNLSRYRCRNCKRRFVGRN